MALKEKYLDIVYNKIKHLIIITENKDKIEIKCIKNDLIYTNSESSTVYKKQYYYQNPFEDIISEFENYKIIIKDKSTDELVMKFNHKISIKNINSDKEFKNGYVIKKKDLEFHIFLENKKIYINVIKDNKTYIFIIDDYEDNYDDICNLIKNEKAKFYEKKEGKLEVFYLEIKYEFDLVLKLPIEDSNVIDKLNIYKLKHFINLINYDQKNQKK